MTTWQALALLGALLWIPATSEDSPAADLSAIAAIVLFLCAALKAI